jgi:hypothetical protein
MAWRIVGARLSLGLQDYLSTRISFWRRPLTSRLLVSISSVLGSVFVPEAAIPLAA